MLWVFYVINMITMNPSILFLCKANVWRSQMAEWYINFLTGQKVAISAALVEDHTKSPLYNGKPALHIQEIMLEDWIDISDQHIKLFSTLWNDVLEGLTNIVLLDKEMIEENQIPWDNFWDNFVHKNIDIIDIPDPVEATDTLKTLDARNSIKKYILENLSPDMSALQFNTLSWENIWWFSNSALQQLRLAARTGFGADMEKDDVKKHLYDNHHLTIVQNNQSIIWFSWIKIFDNFIYRHGTVTHHLFQKRWIYKKLIELDEKLTWLTKFFYKTQNKNTMKWFQKLGYTVLAWQEALNYMQQEMWERFHDNFMGAFEYDYNNLDNWIFRKFYWNRLWWENNVDFVWENDYSTFNSEVWDSLLVVCYK